MEISLKAKLNEAIEMELVNILLKLTKLNSKETFRTTCGMVKIAFLVSKQSKD